MFRSQAVDTRDNRSPDPPTNDRGQAERPSKTLSKEAINAKRRFLHGKLTEGTLWRRQRKNLGSRNKEIVRKLRTKYRSKPQFRPRKAPSLGDSDYMSASTARSTFQARKRKRKVGKGPKKPVTVASTNSQFASLSSKQEFSKQPRLSIPSIAGKPFRDSKIDPLLTYSRHEDSDFVLPPRRVSILAMPHRLGENLKSRSGETRVESDSSQTSLISRSTGVSGVSTGGKKKLKKRKKKKTRKTSKTSIVSRIASTMSRRKVIISPWKGVKAQSKVLYSKELRKKRWFQRLMTPSSRGITLIFLLLCCVLYQSLFFYIGSMRHRNQGWAIFAVNGKS